MQTQLVTPQKLRRISRKVIMNDQDRKAVTQLPPPFPSDADAAEQTLAPPAGTLPSEMAPESEPRR